MSVKTAIGWVIIIVCVVGFCVPMQISCRFTWKDLLGLALGFVAIVVLGSVFALGIILVAG